MNAKASGTPAKLEATPGEGQEGRAEPCGAGRQDNVPRRAEADDRTAQRGDTAEILILIQ
jgi:hypothetical protein